MEGATSAYGLSHRGPNPTHGVQQTQRLRQPPPGPPGPSGRPCVEDQQNHHKPFFYIQPSQPYVPLQGLQWPVPMPLPVSYNPYYSYPGLGYGMPMMPHYQPNPYMEPPSFVVPHTHLHLMDYRRMLNPQYYQTMAYHSRRFRYQHNSPPRETTSCQVQTEPLASTHRTSTPGSNEASSGISVCNSDTTGLPSSQLLSTPLAVPNPTRSLVLKDVVPASPTRTSSNGSFVIQTEEVRIECCTTPVGLQLLHSHETAEESHRYSEDVVQCSSILQGGVLQEDGQHLLPEKPEQTLQACPDILLYGGHSSSDESPAPEVSRNQMDPSVTEVSNLGSLVSGPGDVEETVSQRDLRTSSKNFRFRVVRLPFDAKYLEELRKMESTVWSVEEPLNASPESLIQHGHQDSQEETLIAVPELSEVGLTEKEGSPPEEMVSMMDTSPLVETEDMIPTLEAPSVMDIRPQMGIEEEVAVKLMHSTEVDLAQGLLDNALVKENVTQDREDIRDHRDTSFESLPAYLPSTSWLADFDHVYYCNKMPPTPKKHNKPVGNCGLDVPSRRRKLDLEYKEQHTVHKPKERYKPKGKADRRSLSDHECCLRRNFKENPLASYPSKRERLCSRCLSKQRTCTPSSPGVECGSLKRKALPLQQWNDALVPTCDACKVHTRKQMRKGSNPDVQVFHRGHDTEGESSENGSCHRAPKWRLAEESRKLMDFKRPLASKQNLEKCPAAIHPNPREKNCPCNETVARERLRLCPHGRNFQERDENCAVPVSLQEKWRNRDHFYLTHRWQTGSNSWRTPTWNLDGDVSQNQSRTRHTNKHRKSPSQGTRRKDTRY